MWGLAQKYKWPKLKGLIVFGGNIYTVWNAGVEVKTNEHPYGVITRLKNQVSLVLKLPVSTVTFYVLYIFVGG